MIVPALPAVVAVLLLAGAARAGDARSDDAARVRNLAHGYATLHDAVSGLRFLDEALLVKLESEETRRAMTALADEASRVRRELEDISRRYPALALDDDGLPEIERRKRTLVERDRLRSLAPFTGAGGRDFERTLLLSQSGVLNQLRFTVAALAELEKEARSPRVPWIESVQKRLDRRYVEVVALLDRRFFCPPASSPTGAAGRNAGDP